MPKNKALEQIKILSKKRVIKNVLIAYVQVVIM